MGTIRPAVRAAVKAHDCAASTPTTRMAGLAALATRAMPLARPPPPMGTTIVVHLRPAVANLQGDRAGAGNDVVVAVGRDEGRPGRPRELHRHAFGVLVVGGNRSQFGAVAADGSELGLRSRFWREHHRVQAETLGGPRDRTAVIAGRGRDDHGAWIHRRQPRQCVQGAAHLERPGHLQRLELEPYLRRGARSTATASESAASGTGAVPGGDRRPGCRRWKSSALRMISS